MTTAKWSDIEPVEVSIDALTPSQNHLSNSVSNISYCGDAFIHVILFNGLLYISDGHNRWNTAKMKGDKTIKARVLVKLGSEVFRLNKVA